MKKPKLIPVAKSKALSKRPLEFLLLLGLLFAVMSAGVHLGPWLLDWWAFVLILAFQFSLVGFAEEGLFRLLLMDTLLEKKLRLSPALSVGVSSVVFGAAHLLNGPWRNHLGQALGATVGGVIFAYVYKRYGFLAAVAVHGGYDFLVVLSYNLGWLG